MGGCYVVSWLYKGFDEAISDNYQLCCFRLRSVLNRLSRERLLDNQIRKERSLNDSFYRGPLMLPGLCGILLRFRTFIYGVIADIEKAFLQIELHEPDRDMTRFL
ncbi:unnamed protein product [Enterobius vermicularis]|uniref:Reverse transcriptase domain-containing protein n=1 Tax=Enterobius vermicularis TaxID=51028 RepID=A0A0N4VRP2_ENTVE|nr:unnamed protein product [Enterobius vermicularis]